MGKDSYMDFEGNHKWIAYSSYSQFLQENKDNRIFSEILEQLK